MSLYTTKYLTILRNYALPETNQTFDDLINSTYDKFFNFDFPWYAPDDAGKEDFEKLFLLHYLMYEIGQETIELHRAMLASRLREIMPEFQQIYESLNVDIPWDKNIDVEYTENGTTGKDINGTITGTTHDETSGTSEQESQTIQSDNPQVNFSGTDYASNMDRGQVNRSTNTTADGNTSNTETRNENETRNNSSTESGYRGLNRGDVVEKMRRTMYNINEEIIRRCADLFMLVY